MDKLTLEHLAPYLPYGVKILTGSSIIRELVVDLPSGSAIRTHVPLSYILTGIGHKPILRPISDLIKEIEHNGERFVPWVEINKFLNGGKFQAHYNIIEYNEWDSLTIGFGDHCAGYSLNLESLPVIQMLFKWHFDLFELISQNLAIDINSIEGKETKGNG